MFETDGRNLFQVRAWRGFQWLDHGFGTKAAGYWTPPGETATLRQIHSERVERADSGGECLGEGDALITNEPGVYVSVRTADCVPILMVDGRRQVVAAVHAGWRGTRASIVSHTIERMRQEYGSEPHDVQAAIGPCIGLCCYEVGPEVAQQFGEWMPRLANVQEAVRIDLAEVNRRQLEAQGIGWIAIAGRCTQCDGSFHSYRREREGSGRMVNGIGIVKYR